ncbi:hypothetical protein SD70_22160 [Gordoniibacillus kamchatkensis]|uniref:4-hydroxy-tetrahydrodipicolinate synthase n=1 Tax=Gordoniibacillus kamchatkensis TaxID=1590651 RepID=A0ABR5ADL4_9BACL|nr:4-hydroxy-tetrahydrodipicolinate synthase [Paenibacillus sp. VKM B-2647]KIL39134.1 hypothetical protein SD70_22160 [Paenibacillus sp. VKM B-2647]
MKAKAYRGIMTALVTPIREDGSVNEEQLRRLIRFQIDNAVSSILMLGGTGEYPALTPEARKQAITIAVSEAGGRVPIVAGIIAPGIGDTIEMALFAKEAGVASIMPVAPYYVNPTQQGFLDYFRRLDEAVDMPIFLYNIPYKTGVNMKPETVEALLAAIPNIIGIKECSPDLGQFIDLLRRVGDKIAVLSGEEFLAVSEFILGAQGAVMASANLVPDVWVRMWELTQQGQYRQAVDMSIAYYPLFKAIFKEGNPGPLKAAMNRIGLATGSVSTPLVDPSAATIAELDAAMAALSVR